MGQRFGTAALAVVAAMLLSGAALAASSEQVGSVTILRGGGTNGPQTNPLEIGSGSSTAPRTPAYAPDATGDWNSTHTGSANAGGTIILPPPGAGR